MSLTPREIGTLIVVILKAKNLPNKRHIGKQDPYCSVRLNGETRRTKAIKRGGQHPEWDEELRFTLYEDAEDELARTAGGSGTPPPPPPKDAKSRKIKGGKSMRVSCYADDPREPELIGEVQVDLTEALTKGEVDEWFTLLNKDKYSGQVYLELTFWSNEKPPEKQHTPRPSTLNPQYGGPGSFSPSSNEVPSALLSGKGTGRPSTGGTSSPSRPQQSGKDDSIPDALKASSSLAQLEVYIPPYDQRGGTFGSSAIEPHPSISEFGVMSGSRRRDSYPPLNGTYRQESVYEQLPPPQTTSGYPPNNIAESFSALSLGHPSTTPRPYGHGNHRNTVSVSYSAYPSQFGPPQFQPNLLPQQSGFVPPQPVPTPLPAGFAQRPPVSTGFAPPVPAATPLPPAGFVPPPSAMGFHPYHPPPQPAPTPFQYPPQQFPSQPPATAPPQQFPPQPPTTVPPQQFPPQPPATAPPQQFSIPPAPTPLPTSHSAPPQQFLPPQHNQTPSPSQQQPGPPPAQYQTPPPHTTNIQASRPLPDYPQQSFVQQPQPPIQQQPPVQSQPPIQQHQPPVQQQPPVHQQQPSVHQQQHSVHPVQQPLSPPLPPHGSPSHGQHPPGNPLPPPPPPQFVPQQHPGAPSTPFPPAIPFTHQSPAPPSGTSSPGQPQRASSLPPNSGVPLPPQPAFQQPQYQGNGNPPAPGSLPFPPPPPPPHIPPPPTFQQPPPPPPHFQQPSNQVPPPPPMHGQGGNAPSYPGPPPRPPQMNLPPWQQTQPQPPQLQQQQQQQGAPQYLPHTPAPPLPPSGGYSYPTHQPSW